MEPFLGRVPNSFLRRWRSGRRAISVDALPISSNTALFSLLGTNFGGDGRTTFALPKLAGPCAGADYHRAGMAYAVTQLKLQALADVLRCRRGK